MAVDSRDADLLAAIDCVCGGTELDEPAKNTLSPLTQALLAMIQGLLPALTAVIGGLWIAFTYLETQKEAHQQQAAQAKHDNDTRLLEVRKPFVDAQLKLYEETAKIAGALVSSDGPGAADWQSNYRRFEELFWTELSLVEDGEVKAAMEDFRPRLVAISKLTDSKTTTPEWSELQQSSYRPAPALRNRIQQSWFGTP